MDPNATLKRIRESVDEIIPGRLWGHNSDEIKLSAALDLAEHIEALDAWLLKGGFLPTDWARK